jgi:hypothetical protein
MSNQNSETVLVEERSFMSEALAEIDLSEMGIHIQSELEHFDRAVCAFITLISDVNQANLVTCLSD